MHTKAQPVSRLARWASRGWPRDPRA